MKQQNQMLLWCLNVIIFCGLSWGACSPTLPETPQDASVATCSTTTCTCANGISGVKACNSQGQCSNCVCPPRPEPIETEPTPKNEDKRDEPSSEPIVDAGAPEPTPEPGPPTGAFPTSWNGLWKGPLNIYSGGRITQTIGMELEIRDQTQGKAGWKIVYIDKGQRQSRNYLMETINAAQGHYRVDERNSIFLDSFLFDNLLLSRYNISGNLLDISYKKEGRQITFEGRMSRVNVTKTTGGSGSIPPVGIYFFTVYQRALLKWHPLP